jgi:hypothetical protein
MVLWGRRGMELRAIAAAPHGYGRSGNHVLRPKKPLLLCGLHIRGHLRSRMEDSDVEPQRFSLTTPSTS